MIAALLSGCMAFSVLSLPIKTLVRADEDVAVEEEVNQDEQAIAEFVNRLYFVCLGRDADQDGLDYWVSMLTNRKATGISAAYGFLMSNEFQNRNCTSEEYTRCMYDAFFGREPSDEEITYWVGVMHDGVSKEEVFAGFATSQEFANICDHYGVVRGDYFFDYNLEQTVQVNLFIDRMYTNVLQRTCDADGMTYWTESLLAQRLTGAGVAEGFIFSPEFKARNLCNEHYIKVLYNAFMGREYDEEGLNYWVGALQGGASRETAFNGYVSSREFTNICDSYGILRGDPTADGDTVPTGHCTLDRDFADDIIGDDEEPDIDDGDDDNIDIDLPEIELPEINLDDYTNPDVIDFLTDFQSQGFLILPMNRENSTNLPDEFVEGFMALGNPISESDDIAIVAVVLFESRDSAITYLENSIMPFEPQIIEKETSVEYFFSKDGYDIMCSVNDEGLLYLYETPSAESGAVG